MKKITGLFLIIKLFVMVGYSASSREYTLLSPDKQTKVIIELAESIRFSVEHNGKEVIVQSSPGMTTGKLELGQDPKIKSVKYSSRDESLTPVVPTKFSTIRDHYNQLRMKFRGRYSLVFRAYDNGVAYRFETTLPGEINIYNEFFNLRLPGDSRAWFPQEESIISHYERLYKVRHIKEIIPDEFCSLPVLFETPARVKILVTEADLYDYPCMFLKKGKDGSLDGLFPHVVNEVRAQPGSRVDRNEDIVEEADFIAKTKGSRSYPWRVFMIAEKDGDLLLNDLVYQLSSPLQLEETDWIRPGLVSWDWWNALNVYGVDFESGINNQTYKHYIDFASDFGLDYIILDEGWSAGSWDIMECNDEIDVEELVNYGKEKDVGIILWTLWKPLDQKLTDVLDLYEKWGVKGIKVDFMQRADQYMVNYYERVARQAASRHLMVDFHGAFKPSGLRRAYPNLMSYEGVKGLENCKWSKDITPEHNVTLPFIRMAAGPMDYTPGAMDNAHMENYMIRFTRPMSMGTRCHQMAMYAIYESPLQMLCDIPTNYYSERECTEFISWFPTVWDETVVLEASLADYVVLARRNGEDWYMGAMTDDTARDFDLDFSFLSDGDYEAVIMEDGINADKVARDYRRKTSIIHKGDKMKISLARGGGWAAVLTVKR